MQITARTPNSFEIKAKDGTVLINDHIQIGDFKITDPGEYEVSGIMAEVNNTVTRLYTEDMTLAVMRSPKTKLSEEQLEELGALQVLFFPIVSSDFNAKELVNLFTQTEAPLIIPMFENKTILDAFCLSVPSCERQAGALKITKSQLPEEGSRIIVFE